jgi:hypothetical protein
MVTLQGDAPFMTAMYEIRSSLAVLESNFPDLEALELPLFVPTKCYLRVDLDGWEGEANVLQVQDELGKPLIIKIETGGVTKASMAFGLWGGRLDRITVPERARSVVLLMGSKEVARIPVQPRPGEVVEVRL